MRLKDLKLGQIIKINTNNQKKDTYGVVLGVSNESYSSIIDLEQSKPVQVYVYILCKYVSFVHSKELQGKAEELIALTVKFAMQEEMKADNIIMVGINKLKEALKFCISENDLQLWIAKSQMLGKINLTLLTPEQMTEKIENLKKQKNNLSKDYEWYLNKVQIALQTKIEHVDDVLEKGRLYLYYDFDFFCPYFIVYLCNNKFLYITEADSVNAHKFVLNHTMDAYLSHIRTLTSATLYSVPLNLCELEYNRIKIEEICNRLKK